MTNAPVPIGRHSVRQSVWTGFVYPYDNVTQLSYISQFKITTHLIFLLRNTITYVARNNIPFTIISQTLSHAWRSMLAARILSDLHALCQMPSINIAPRRNVGIAMGSARSLNPHPDGVTSISIGLNDRVKVMLNPQDMGVGRFGVGCKYVRDRRRHNKLETSSSIRQWYSRPYTPFDVSSSDARQDRWNISI